MTNSNKIILITGAKGFLGREIVKKLLVSGCQLKLLIRNSTFTEITVEDFIRDTFMDEELNAPFLNNIEILEGDITSDFLGLDESVYNRLCSEVDEIFHCAAATHFEKQREDELMEVNVGGTKNILLFAATNKKKRLHHISTAYVFGKQGGVVFEKEAEEVTQFNNGYEKSKYITEQTVIKYAKENAVPFTIYRPSIIVGDSETGFTSRYDNLYLFAKVLYNIKNSHINDQSNDDQRNDSNEDEKGAYSKERGKGITIRVPGNPNALVNLVPINYVADAIVAISEKADTIGKIFHIVNPDPPRLEELKDIFMSVLEIDGVNILIEGEVERKQLSTTEKLFLRQTKPYYSYLFSNLRFDCKETQNALDGTGIVCPTITLGLIKSLMNYAVTHDWGAKGPVSLQKAEIC